MAAEERFELPLTESKSVVLPLHYSAILSKNKNEMLNKIRQNFIFDLALPYHLANPVYNWWLLHLALGIETTKQVRCKHQSLEGKPFALQHLILTYLVGRAGLEPTTPSSSGLRSTN